MSTTLYSAWHSGNVYVAWRSLDEAHLDDTVFAPYPATGYGLDKESKEMPSICTRTHHPALATNGDYDGRWLFVNDNANNRMED